MTEPSPMLNALHGLLQGANRLAPHFQAAHLPGSWRDDLAGLGDRGELILQLAGRLAGGEPGQLPLVDPRDRASPRQLRTIFAGIQVDGQGHPKPAQAYLPLKPLALVEEVLFPGGPLARDDAAQAFAALQSAFIQTAASLQNAHESQGDLPTYLESLLLLLQRTAWCVPAFDQEACDVSLYDWSRMTAALAAVLDREDVDKSQLQRWLGAPAQVTEELALLVGGDISGVQDFIYTITARGATPGLRGRSFYLQLLTEAVARYVLRELALPITNLIYAGGGNFFILARPGDQARLQAIREAVSRALLQHHRGSLYVAVAGTPLRGQDFFQGGISEAWGRLHEELQEVKRRRFAELPGEELAQVFQPQGHGGGKEIQCQVCGQEHKDAKPDGDEEDSPRKCPACLAFEDLGDALRNARFLALDLVAPQPVTLDLEQPYGAWEEVLEALGLQLQVAETPSHLEAAPAGSRRVLLALDDAGMAELSPDPRQAVGRRLLVNVTPILTAEERRELQDDSGFPEADRKDLPAADKVKPFSVLAYQAQGIKRLGVLRMDVDNLGKLFQEGLGDRSTLSRVAGLSFAVSLYFEGWVDALAAEVNAAHRHPKYPTGDRLYAIYSGGDDLFFVGSWDVVVELAIRIRADLGRYTGGHPGIHASGGLVFIGGKYPLYQAADDARDAEHAAKALRWQDGNGASRTKDGFCFLGEPLPWANFGLDTDCPPNLETVHGLMHFLHGLTQGNGQGNGEKAAPKSLLRRLIELYGQYVEAREAWRRTHGEVTQEGQPQVLWGPWTWRAVYVLARMKKRTKNEEIQDLVNELRATDYRLIERIGMAARWADLLGRGRG